METQGNMNTANKIVSLPANLLLKDMNNSNFLLLF